jgi:hypothetical protein
MAKSIRISDALYELATHEAELMGRSLAQQIEHWVRLGVGVEHAPGARVDAVRDAALQFRQSVNDAAVRSGRRSAYSLHAVSPRTLEGAKLEFPPAAFATRRKTW